MLKRQFRLPSYIRLSQAYIYTSDYYILKIATNGLDINRVGFVVGKVVDKRAVIRNRTKRVLRCIIEDVFMQLKTGNDILFIVKKPIEKRTIMLEKELIDVLKSLQLIV